MAKLHYAVLWHRNGQPAGLAAGTKRFASRVARTAGARLVHCDCEFTPGNGIGQRYCSTVFAHVTTRRDGR